MTENSNEENKARPESSDRMSSFRMALLSTAIPAVALSLISLAVTNLWLGAIFFVVAAFIASIMFLIFGYRSIAAGILTGVGIGIIAIGATCFANVGNF